MNELSRLLSQLYSCFLLKIGIVKLDLPLRILPEIIIYGNIGGESSTLAIVDAFSDTVECILINLGYRFSATTKVLYACGYVEVG